MSSSWLSRIKPVYGFSLSLSLYPLFLSPLYLYLALSLARGAVRVLLSGFCLLTCLQLDGHSSSLGIHAPVMYFYLRFPATSASRRISSFGKTRAKLLGESSLSSSAKRISSNDREPYSLVSNPVDVAKLVTIAVGHRPAVRDPRDKFPRTRVETSFRSFGLRPVATRAFSKIFKRLENIGVD